LNFHFRALKEIPEMFIVPSKIVVDDKEYEKILNYDDEPNEQLKKLLNDN
jgi:hypothetical protein